MTTNTNAKTIQPLPTKPEWMVWLLMGLFVFYFLAIQQFPITFLDSEAAPLIAAEELLTNQFHFQGSRVFPAYFQFQRPMDMGSLVYLLMAPFISFGKQIWVVRGVSVIASLLTSWWVYQIAKKHLKLNHALLVFFVMVSVPGWVLLSRIGSTAIIRTAAYTGFLFYYLEYRYSDPKAIFKSLAAAFFVFYGDFNGQILMLVNGLFFLAVDFRIHWARKKAFFLTLLGVIVTLIPWILYLNHHPGTYAHIMPAKFPAGLQADGIGNLMGEMGLSVLNGINPFHWAVHHSGHSPVFYLGPFRFYPFFHLSLLPVGIVLLQKIKEVPKTWFWVCLFSPAAVSLFLPVTPFSMAAVLPAYFLLVSITLNTFLNFLQKKLPALQKVWFPFVSILLAGYGCYFLSQAIFHSADWVNRFDREGVQYGSKEIFEQIKQFETAQPENKYALNTAWSNHPEVLRQFYAADVKNIEYNVLNGYVENIREDISETIFLLENEDLNNIRSSGKFMEPFILSTIRLPDGSPLYTFVRLTYTPESKLIMQAELESRRQPQKLTADWLGQQVDINHPALSIGPVTNVIDGDETSLIKSDRVNPLDLVFAFERTVQVSQIQFLVGSEAVDVFLYLYPPETSEAVVYSQKSGPSEGNKTILIKLEDTLEIQRLEVYIQDKNESENSSIHLWEIRLDP